MKKVFLLASVAALALGSCTSELDGPNMPDQTNYKSKIIVSNGNADSRTSIDQAGDYVWNLGDAIGIFNAIETDATNAVFQYTSTTSGREGVFGGQTELLAQSEYYGYYPWAYGTLVASNVITLNIPATQNYNFAAAEWGGSFAQNTSPAVGYGTTEEANIGTFSFYPVASYIKIPVTGYAPASNPVTTVSLQIIDGTTQQPVAIAGAYTVNMEEFAEVKDESKPYLATGIELTGTEKTITLNCGKGVTISNEITWFWFVVPAGLNLSNQTVSVSINEGEAMTRTITTENAATTRNTPAVIYADSDKNPFVYYPEGTAYIQTEAQFLEYVNIVTNGIDEEAYEKMLNNNPGQAAWSIYPQIVNEAGDGVNPAVIVNPLVFTQQKIKDLIGAGGDGNTIIGSSASLDPYFTFLQNYATKGTIPTIGGTISSFSISGANQGTEEDPDYVSISGLDIVGNGMFFNSTSSSNKIAISGLVLDDVTVNATGTTAPYTFLCNQVWAANGNTFADITVNSNCVLMPAATIEAPGALFNSVSNGAYANNMISNVTTDVEGMLFANILTINQPSGFDFTAEGNPSVDEFKNVAVLNSGAKSILYVNDKTEAVELMGMTFNNASTTAASNKFLTSGNGFSVVQKATKTTNAISFWTGTTYANDGKALLTAEELAYAAQTPQALTAELNADINLMGDGGEGLTWWAVNNSDANLINLSGEFTISNAYIDGTKGDATEEAEATLNEYGFISLFGQYAALTDVTITDITLNNVTKLPNAQIAAVASTPFGYPSFTIGNINVINDVELVYFGNAVGGAFCVVNYPNALSLTVDGTLNPDLNADDTETAVGFVAGQLDWTTSPDAEQQVLNNPAAKSNLGGYNAFGTVKVSVSYIKGTNPVITLNGFDSYIFPTVAKGEVVKNIVAANTDNTENGYIVQFVYGGTTYQYKYSTEEKAYVYDGTVN